MAREVCDGLTHGLKAPKRKYSGRGRKYVASEARLITVTVKRQAFMRVPANVSGFDEWAFRIACL